MNPKRSLYFFIFLVALFTILFSFISSCARSLPEQTDLSGYTVVHFSGSRTSTNSALSLLQVISNPNQFMDSFSHSVLSGGLLIYVFSTSYSESLFLSDETASGSMTIPNGAYRVYAVGYENASTPITNVGSLTSTMKCANFNAGQFLDLNGGRRTINVNLNSSDCITATDFTPTSMQASGVPLVVDLHSCSYGYPFNFCSDGTCPVCADGDIQSFRLKLINYQKTGGVVTQKTGGLQQCIQASVNGAGSNNPTNAKVPTGHGNTSPFIVEMGAYTASSSDCSGTPSRIYTFTNGLGEAFGSTKITSAGTSNLSKDSTTSRLHLYMNNTSASVAAKSIGRTTASTGTCSSTGFTAKWCTGGTFGSGAGDGMMNGPESVAIDSTNNILYVADTFNSRIQKLSASTGEFLGAIGNVTSSTGTCPGGVCLESS